MPFLESNYFATMLHNPLQEQLEVHYRQIFEVNTSQKVLHFVDGFFQRTAGEWFLLAELTDGSFGVYVEIEEFYASSELFKPLSDGLHVYYPCKREDGERVLVDALLDDEEEYSLDLAYQYVAQGNPSEAEKVKDKYKKCELYLRERLNGEDEESARVIVVLTYS